ncbi:MAG: hypothetical protein KIH67_002890 [Candidatus Moranbacteria bacterium]|nr:hypothetical protein [Candidatus Moranbacteria bacterium]
MKIQYHPKSILKFLPDGFVHPTQSRKYLRASFTQSIKLLGEVPYLGALCDYGWIQFEYFTTESEPAKSSEKGFGIQIWHQVGLKKTPPGWWPLFPFLRRSSIAFLDMKDGLDENWSQCSEHVRRQRKKWLAQEEYFIEEATKKEFLEAYQKSTLTQSLKKLFKKSLERHCRVYGEDVYFLVVREKKSDKILAGFMTVDDFVVSQSFYPVAFILPEAKKIAASVGIVDHWIAESRKKAIRYINLGIVWMPGDPPSWKGYSYFKALFHPNILLFQKPLIRFYWNREKSS